MRRTSAAVNGFWLTMGAVVFASFAGCAFEQVVVRDVATQGDGWSLFVEVMTDGPDSVSPIGSPTYLPEAGERFFWVRLKLRNDAAMNRQFNFDRCELDLGDKGIVPALVSMAPVVVAADHVVTASPGETLKRTLIFSYPRNVSPTRLTCIPMVIRLPAIAAG